MSLQINCVVIRTDGLAQASKTEQGPAWRLQSVARQSVATAAFLPFLTITLVLCGTKHS